MHSHPDLDEFESYALNRGSSAVRRMLEEHLLICDECRDTLEETEREIAVMRIALRNLELETPIYCLPVVRYS